MVTKNVLFKEGTSKKKTAPKNPKIINVRGLRTQAEIQEFKWALSVVGKARDVMLFSFGINTGLRVSDILPLKVGQVRGRADIRIREKKTKKYKTIYFTEGLQDEIEEYTRRMSDEMYMFPSQKGEKPISVTQAYRVLQKAADLLGRDDIGTHTMRKTYGYMHYKLNKDVAMLQDIFQHATPQITLRYIGVTEEAIKQSQRGMYL